MKFSIYLNRRVFVMKLYENMVMVWRLWNNYNQTCTFFALNMFCCWLAQSRIYGIFVTLPCRLFILCSITCCFHYVLHVLLLFLFYENIFWVLVRNVSWRLNSTQSICFRKKVSTQYFCVYLLLRAFYIIAISANDMSDRRLLIKHINKDPMHDKPSKWHVRLAKTQIILGFSQCVAKIPNFLHVDSNGSDHTGRLPRLIWVFAGRTCHFVGFVMRWLKYKWRNIQEILHTNTQPSRGTKRSWGEEQMMTKQAPNIKPPKHKQRRIATEEPPLNCQ